MGRMHWKAARVSTVAAIFPFASLASAAISGSDGVAIDGPVNHGHELVLDPNFPWSQADRAATNGAEYLVTPTTLSEDSEKASGAGASDSMDRTASSAPVAIPLPNAAFLFMTGAIVATVAVRRTGRRRA